MPSRHKQRWGRAPLRSAPKPKALKDRIKPGGHPLFFNDLTGTVLARYPVHFYSAIDNLKAFRQIGKSNNEACGILLGRQYEGAIEVTNCTPPQPSDKRTRLGYVRKLAGHLEIAMQIWDESNGFVGYVGGWHTKVDPSVQTNIGLV